MISKLGLAIDPGEMGFKRFLKYQISVAQNKISAHDSNLFSYIDLEEYAESVKINDLYNKFINGLSDDELKVVRYLNYHSPIEKEPENMLNIYKSLYERWKKIFFDEKAYLKGINPRRIATLMKRIRAHHYVSVATLSRILDVDRSTVYLYEHAKRIPSLNYIYKFCKMFHLKIDDLVNLTINESMINEKKNKPIE